MSQGGECPPENRLWIFAEMGTVFLRLMGGLGNQLFQYSFGEWLRHRLGTPAVLYDPGSDKVPGPLSRAVQLPELFRNCRILRGAGARTIHSLSLSRKYQKTIRTVAFRRFDCSPTAEWAEIKRQIQSATRYRYPVITGYFQSREPVQSERERLREHAADAIDSKMKSLVSAGRLFDLDPRRDCVIHIRLGDYKRIEGNRV